MLTGRKSLQRQADELLALGPEAVLPKGSHAGGDASIDRLYRKNQPVQEFTSPRLTATLRGTGCTLASAIAVRLAVGSEIAEACVQAKSYVGRKYRQLL